MAFAKYIYADRHILNTETDTYIYLYTGGPITKIFTDISDANTIKNRMNNRPVILEDLKKLAFHPIKHESTKQFLREMIAWLVEQNG